MQRSDDLVPASPDPLAALDDVIGSPAADGAGPRPRRVLLAAAAAVAALCVGLAAGAALGQPAPPLAPPVPTPPPATPSPPSATPGPPSPAAPAADITAAAVVAVRLAAPDDHYVDSAAAERVTSLPDVAVVTVRAVVLEREGDRWGAPRAARFGVAVGQRHGEAVAVGRPWPLPPPPEPLPVADTAVADTALVAAAARALAAAGYRDASAPALTAAAGDLMAARLTGIAPGERRAREHTVWLTADAATVLGLPPDGGDDEKEVQP